ncbi:hypothetical protein VTN77DRAFT_2375 [Rasamsonia byssochlamydoides]|uniref:uncharacterized protein n=1 Tax=Rasamsonia byssochlamydoides TaxID=89139 RepID=UPI003744001E
MLVDRTSLLTICYPFKNGNHLDRSSRLSLRHCCAVLVRGWLLHPNCADDRPGDPRQSESPKRSHRLGDCQTPIWDGRASDLYLPVLRHQFVVGDGHDPGRCWGDHCVDGDAYHRFDLLAPSGSGGLYRCRRVEGNVSDGLCVSSLPTFFASFHTSIRVYAWRDLSEYLILNENWLSDPFSSSHTLIVMVILCFLTLKAFNNPAITDLNSFYDILVNAEKTRNIEGNYQGSILSFKSKSSVIFGLVHSFGDFALVIMDTSFWQKGFAADTAATMPGYMLGGIAYFAVPWAVGTTAGLAAIGLENTPIFRQMTTSEINAGYVLPYTVMAVAGKGGAFALLLVVIMCVTSTTSAELIAVSSIFSFDIYRTYINPKLMTGK